MSPDISLGLLNEAIVALGRIANPATGQLKGPLTRIAGEIAQELDCTEERAGQAMRVLQFLGVLTGPPHGATGKHTQAVPWALVKPDARVIMRQGFLTAVEAGAEDN